MAQTFFKTFDLNTLLNAKILSSKNNTCFVIRIGNHVYKVFKSREACDAEKLGYLLLQEACSMSRTLTTFSDKDLEWRFDGTYHSLKMPVVDGKHPENSRQIWSELTSFNFVHPDQSRANCLIKPSGQVHVIDPAKPIGNGPFFKADSKKGNPQRTD